MTHDELVRSLLVERYGRTTPEWHPSVEDLLASAERVLWLEQAERQENREGAA